jgi:hypothetical protein
MFSHYSYTHTNKNVRELIAVKVLHTSSLKTTMVEFKVLPLGIYAPMPAPSSHFKAILELVLWNGLQSCRCITPDVTYQKAFLSIFPSPSGTEKSHWGLDPVNSHGVPTQLFV